MKLSTVSGKDEATLIAERISSLFTQQNCDPTLLFPHYFLDFITPHYKNSEPGGIRGGDGRKVTRQALGTVNYNRHHCPIFQLQAPHVLITGLAGEYCGYVHSLRLRLFDFSLTDCERSPSMTNIPDEAPHRTRNRTDEPALWRLICHWMVGGTFQTRYVWRQNTQERN